jgi:hypothetical protein
MYILVPITFDSLSNLIARCRIINLQV